MTQPIITWTDQFGDSLEDNRLNFGTVDAGDNTVDFTVLLWNNKGGTSDVSSMTDCVITTKDMYGGNGESELLNDATKELILNKWISVRRTSESVADPGFYNSIGGLDNINVFADAVVEEEGEVLVDAISGSFNDGDIDNEENKKNYSTLIFRATIPDDASAGAVQFLTRVSYRYI